MRARTLAAPAALILSASCAAARTPAPPPTASNTDAVATREWLSKQPEGCAAEALAAHVKLAVGITRRGPDPVSGNGVRESVLEPLRLK